MLASLNILNSALTSSLRGWQGIQSRTDVAAPAQRLQLFNRENCPYCRLVREALNELNLDVEIYPASSRDSRFYNQLKALSGATQVPFLVDPNTDTNMAESMDIVHYLFKTYGVGKVPLQWRFATLQTMSSYVASVARVLQVRGKKAACVPDKMLELYSFEGSPFARPVRELLNAMALPYVLKSCGRSKWQEWLLPPLRQHLNISVSSQLANRVELQAKEGRMSIPYLWDPNTQRGLFESEDIMDYLRKEYG